MVIWGVGKGRIPKEFRLGDGIILKSSLDNSQFICSFCHSTDT